MRSHHHLVALLVLTGVLTGCGSKSKPTAPGAPIPLATTVETIRARHGLPALAIAVIDRDSIHVTVRGVRKLGTPTPAQTGDLFHLGSLVKPMTATMIARLVEAGSLSWDRTLLQAFPEFGDSMVTAYRNVTLRQLLQHRGGVPAFETLVEFAVLPTFTGTSIDQRLAFVRWLVTRPPAVPPGTYLYSNAGYGVAAAIAEAATGSPGDALTTTQPPSGPYAWHQLLTSLILNELGGATTFGWPTDHDAAQPWGHAIVGGSLTPIDPNAGRVPVVVAPAGDLSQSLEAYGRFAQLHLRALLGTPELLSAGTYAVLHTPPAGGDYAMGWQRLTFQGRLVYTHEGSAGTFATFVLLDPARGGAYVLATNALSESVESAFVELLTAVIPRSSALPARYLVAPAALRGGLAGPEATPKFFTK